MHRARLMRLALRLCTGDRDAASDLAQQAIANACCQQGLNGDLDLWPYLRTSLLHLYIDRARLLKRNCRWMLSVRTEAKTCSCTGPTRIRLR